MPKPTLPPDLDDINRMLLQWATGWNDFGVGFGQTHPLETIRKMHEGATRSGPVPEPIEYKQIDELLLEAPAAVSNLIKIWYRNNWPVATKAKRLGIHRSTIYERWKEALRYVQGAMKARGIRCIS